VNFHTIAGSVPLKSSPLFSRSILPVSLMLLATLNSSPAYSQPPSEVATTPVSQASKIGGQVTDEQVAKAVAVLEAMAQKEIDNKEVVGIAVAVVHKNKLVYSKGFGARDVGKPDAIDADTVFQLASISKSVASTVVAELIGEGKISWDSKISDLDPDFQMYDPWVTRQITIRDFFSHRSGLPEHAGDLLEDLGADRAQVLHNLRYQKPDSSFRSHYNYTNFGLTEGSVAAVKPYGLSWEDASKAKLYGPLGMTSTSSRFSDFNALQNKALGHVLQDGKWVQKFRRQPDAQSPAGGVSSSVNDMAKWMRLQLANGKFDGKQIVDEKALVETHHPAMLTQFNPFNGLPGFYGLGMNVNYDERGRLRLGHSGGFAQGAGTNVSMVPSEELGVIVLTNCPPIGVAEGLATAFTDVALNGKQSRDWLAIFKKFLADPAAIGVFEGFDYSKKPTALAPAASNIAYVGSYKNNFFGDLEIVERGGGLAIVLGPQKMTVPMNHYNRDTFTYETSGENAVGLSGITFTVSADGKSQQVLVEHLNDCGEGTFTRVTK